MKPMIWHPEPSDEKVNQYLDRVNREPWLTIFAVSLVIVSLFTVLVALGVF
jgi:cell division protein FtsX